MADWGILKTFVKGHYKKAFVWAPGVGSVFHCVLRVGTVKTIPLNRKCVSCERLDEVGRETNWNTGKQVKTAAREQTAGRRVFVTSFTSLLGVTLSQLGHKVRPSRMLYLQ